MTIAAYSSGTVANSDKVYAWATWSKNFDRGAYRAYSEAQRAFSKRLAKAEKLNRDLRAKVELMAEREERVAA